MTRRGVPTTDAGARAGRGPEGPRPRRGPACDRPWIPGAGGHRMTRQPDLIADVSEILLTEEEIQAKVRDLAAGSADDYAGRARRSWRPEGLASIPWPT